MPYNDNDPISVIEIFTDGPDVVEIYTEPLAVLDVQTLGPQGPIGPEGPQGEPGDVLYTNTTPTPIYLGGIEEGTTFDHVSLQDMFDNLLYPETLHFQDPVIYEFPTPMLTWTIEHEFGLYPDVDTIVDGSIIYGDIDYISGGPGVVLVKFGIPFAGIAVIRP